ncbi:hypothetical protein ACQZ5G_14850 [Agrobacterium sp. 22-214-1]
MFSGSVAEYAIWIFNLAGTLARGASVTAILQRCAACEGPAFRAGRWTAGLPGKNIRALPAVVKEL